MKKIYVVRPALYFAREFVKKNKRDIQGFLLMMMIWVSGLITGMCFIYWWLY